MKCCIFSSNPLRTMQHILYSSPFRSFRTCPSWAASGERCPACFGTRGAGPARGGKSTRGLTSAWTEHNNKFYHQNNTKPEKQIKKPRFNQVRQQNLARRNLARFKLSQNFGRISEILWNRKFCKNPQNRQVEIWLIIFLCHRFHHQWFGFRAFRRRFGFC